MLGKGGNIYELKKLPAYIYSLHFFMVLPKRYFNNFGTTFQLKRYALAFALQHLWGKRF